MRGTTLLSCPGPAWRMSCNELKCTCVVKIFAGAVRVAVSPDTDCETCGSSILTVEYNPVCYAFNIDLQTKAWWF